MSQQLSTIVTSVKRIRSSRDGNPRFEFTTSTGIYLTAPDTSAAYDVENYFGNIDSGTGVPALLKVDSRGNIFDWVL